MQKNCTEGFNSQGIDPVFILGILNSISIPDFLPNPEYVDLEPLIEFL